MLDGSNYSDIVDPNSSMKEDKSLLLKTKITLLSDPMAMVSALNGISSGLTR